MHRTLLCTLGLEIQVLPATGPWSGRDLQAAVDSRYHNAYP